MADEKQLKQTIQEYEQILGIGEYSIEKDAFYALCRITMLQTVRLNRFNLETEIAKDAKEDKIYERTMAIVKELPKMISDISSLRKELGVEKKDAREQYLKQSITPESVSNVLGNTAGQPT